MNSVQASLGWQLDCLLRGSWEDTRHGSFTLKLCSQGMHGLDPLQQRHDGQRFLEWVLIVVHARALRALTQTLRPISEHKLEAIGATRNSFLSGEIASELLIPA